MTIKIAVKTHTTKVAPKILLRLQKQTWTWGARTPDVAIISSPT